jgi:hypothetical protein
VRKKLITVWLVVAGLVLVGGVAYLLADDGSGSGARGPAEKASAGRKGAPAVPFGDVTFDGGAIPGGASAALTPEEQARIKAVLEKLGNETAVHAAFTAGVAQPWPLPAAQVQFEGCVTRVVRGLPPDSAVVPGELCACAIRAFQDVYPREPPQPATGRGRKMVAENFRTALRECMEPR